MRYRNEPLSEPVCIRRGRGRPVLLTEAVIEDKKIIAVFRDMHTARAYAQRRNKLSEVKA